MQLNRNLVDFLVTQLVLLVGYLEINKNQAPYLFYQMQVEDCLIILIVITNKNQV